MIVPAGMVFGVVLGHGERVVYYHRDDPGWQKPLMIIVGLLLTIGVIGIFLLIAGIMATTNVYVMTTRRLIVIEGFKGKNVKSIKYTDVKSVLLKKTNGNLKWIDISDGKITQQWQVAANAKNMPELIDKFLKDPTSAENADGVWHDSVASKKPAKLPAPST